MNLWDLTRPLRSCGLATDGGMLKVVGELKIGTKKIRAQL